MSINGEFAIFLVLSVFIVTGAVLMISLTKVVHMVVALAVTFVGLGGMYVLLDAEFIAFVQILVYAGAITILMIFGIMMTKHQHEEELPKRPLHDVLLALGTLGLFGILFYAIRTAEFPDNQLATMTDNTLEIGMQLFTSRVIPFELVSVLLTVAFIGAIVLAKKEEGEQ